MDRFHAAQYHVAALLDCGIDALIYVGKYDWICNLIGNERWTLALEWSGKDGFVNQELRPLNICGEKVRNSGPFVVVTVDGAGGVVRSFCSIWKMRPMFDAFHRVHTISLSRRWRLQGDGWMALNSSGTMVLP